MLYMVMFSLGMLSGIVIAGIVCVLSFNKGYCNSMSDITNKIKR